MSTLVIVVSALLVVSLLAPIGLYELHKNSSISVVNKRTSLTTEILGIPPLTPIPVHIPMVALTTQSSYDVPYWLGGFAVSTPSPTGWTLPPTYANGGKVQPGEFLQIRNYGPSIITLYTTPPETIDFASSYTILVNQTVKILSNYPNWVVTTPANGIIDTSDYGAVGDGVTDDTLAFQIALNALAVSGGSLYVPPGNYSVTSLILQNCLRSGIFFGSGGSSLLVRANTTVGSTNLISVRNCPYIRIESLAFQANILKSVTGYADACINIKDSPYATVSNCIANISYSPGIFLWNSNYATAIGNIIYGITLDPSVPSNDSNAVLGIAVRDSCVGCSVLNNIVSNTTYGIHIQAVINNTLTTDMIISNNRVYNSSAYGIFIYNNGLNLTPVGTNIFRGFSVVGNVVATTYGSLPSPFTTPAYSFSTGACIYLQGAEDSSVSGNVVSRCNIQTAVYQLAPGAIGVANTQRVSVTGNSISSPFWWGIFLNDAEGLGSPNGAVTISGNSIVCTSGTTLGGIRVESVDYTSISGNTVNFCGGTSPSIFVVANTATSKVPRSGSITGNTIDNAAVGIQVQALAIGAVSGNIIRLISSGTGVALAQNFNNALSSTGLAVSGNIVFAATSGTSICYRVFLYCTSCTLTSNQAQGCVTQYQVDAPLLSFSSNAQSAVTTNAFNGANAPARYVSGSFDTSGMFIARADSSSVSLTPSASTCTAGRNLVLWNYGSSGTALVTNSASGFNLRGAISASIPVNGTITLFCTDQRTWQEIARNF